MKISAIIPCAATISLAVLVLIGVAIPTTVKRRSHAEQNACINNLRMIYSAKEQAALADTWNDGVDCDVPRNKVRVNMYMKGNTTPICPGRCRRCAPHWWQGAIKGAPYAYNAVGTNPTCNTKGLNTLHRLPYEQTPRISDTEEGGVPLHPNPQTGQSDAGR